MKLQDDIRRMLGNKTDFPALWKGVDQKTREKHYFTAMKRVCPLQNMENQRRYAGEAHSAEAKWYSCHSVMRPKSH